jgi:hypothetical protein
MLASTQAIVPLIVAPALQTFSSRDAATLAHGLRITPAFLENRRRSQPGGGLYGISPSRIIANDLSASAPKAAGTRALEAAARLERFPMRAVT